MVDPKNFAHKLLLSAALPIACFTMAASAVAQDVEPVSNTQNEEVSDGGDEVIVTGSRISRDGFDAPSPTNVISAENIQFSGTPNLIDVLNEQPQITNGFFNQNTSFGFGNVGLNQLDLRDLGVRRTLTIVDGRRRAGTADDSNFLAFDLSNIPSALVDRVEVITGGTSAVYGADAVAGVVNILLKDDFEGFEVSAQGSRNFSEGDYSSFYVNGMFGANFDNDRGNAVFSVGYSKNDRLFKRDRGLENDFRFLSNPDDTGPGDGIPGRIIFDDVRFAYFGINTPTGFLPIGNDGNASGTWSTVIWDNALNRFRLFDGGRTLGRDIDGFASLGSDGGDGRFFDTQVAPSRRINAYTKVDYELTPDINARAEFIFADTKSADIIGPVFDVFSTFVTTDNAFMPQQTRDALSNAGQSGFWLSRQHNEFGPRMAEMDREYFSFSAGVDGNLFNDKVAWELVYDYGQSNTQNTNRNDRLDANWFNAIDSIIDPGSGRPVCRDAAARAAGCVPVNVFGSDTISAEALSYISADHITTNQTSQELIQLLFTGEAFELPAGPIKYAAGLEYRNDTIDFRPSHVWENALGFFGSQFSPVNESNSVKEAFAEVLVPVVKDKPLIQRFEVEGAYRVSDYERAGTTNSWKIGGTWEISDDLRLRGTRARAVRAPSLGELFDPGSRGASSIGDPCDPLNLDAGTANRRANCQALGLDPVAFDPDTRRVTTLVFTTGNPDLEVEVGNTLTIGAVATPSFIPGLRVSADYFDIDLAEGIDRIGAQQTADNCVDLDTINNQFCGFVTRDGTGNIREISDSYVNVAGLKIRGVDVQATYDFELEKLLGGGRDIGDVRLGFVGTKNIDNQFIDRDIVSGEESTSENVGLSFLPEYRMIGTVSYNKNNFGARWQSRFSSSTATNVPVTEANIDDRGDEVNITSIWYHDLSASYDFERFSLYAGVNNVFDKGPRRHPFTIAGTNIIDDVIGRRFFVGVNYKFGAKN